MNALTQNELRVLDNLSKVHDKSVELGQKLQEIIGASGETGTPVNAVNALATLAVSGVCVDGETFTVGTDTYEFLADDAQTKTAPDNIAINIVSKTGKATGTLTIATQPTSGDTITIGSKTYIFVPVGTANSDGEISIGASLSDAQDAVTAAVNGTDSVNTKHPSVSISAFSANAATITALVGGTAGNSIATTETFAAADNVFSAATLASGTNCTTANTAAAIIAAVNANTDLVVDASAGSSNNVILTAKIAGVSGNSISVSETMANATFGVDVAALSGGVDGTVAAGTKFMFDNSYMYVCPTGNTVSQKNWRRVSIGSAY